MVSCKYLYIKFMHLTSGSTFWSLLFIKKRWYFFFWNIVKDIHKNLTLTTPPSSNQSNLTLTPPSSNQPNLTLTMPPSSNQPNLTLTVRGRRLSLRIFSHKGNAASILCLGVMIGAVIGFVFGRIRRPPPSN